MYGNTQNVKITTSKNRENAIDNKCTFLQNYYMYVYAFQREQHGIWIWPVSLLLGTNSLKGRCHLVLEESNSQFILRMGYKWVSCAWRMQHSLHINTQLVAAFTCNGQKFVRSSHWWPVGCTKFVRSSHWWPVGCTKFFNLILHIFYLW